MEHLCELSGHNSPDRRLRRAAGINIGSSESIAAESTIERGQEHGSSRRGLLDVLQTLDGTGKETLNASVLQDAADDLAPAFIATERFDFLCGGFLGCEPGAREGQKGSNQAPAIRQRPAAKVGMPKAGPQVRCGALRVQVHPVAPARQIAADVKVVTRRKPQAGDGQQRGLRVAQNAVGPDRGC